MWIFHNVYFKFLSFFFFFAKAFKIIKITREILKKKKEKRIVFLAAQNGQLARVVFFESDLRDSLYFFYTFLFFKSLLK